jgi:uncharacterized membrane protein
MKKLIKPFILFYIGGAIYYLLEIIWRGYSHSSMFIVGGLCFVLIGLINETKIEIGLVYQAILSSIIITTIEFVSGIILNVFLKLNIWDYSDRLFNVAGQIYLLYSLLWILLSVIAIVLDDYIRYWLFSEEKPTYKLL